jgi:hypothetical protein
MMFHRTWTREEDTPWLPAQLILEELQRSGRCTVEEMLERVPQLTWSQLFLAMDLLSRRGEIELTREGFTYSLRMRPAASRMGSHDAAARPDHR